MHIIYATTFLPRRKNYIVSFVHPLISRSQQLLMMIEEHEIYLIDIINFLCYEILYDHVEHTARRQRITGSRKQSFV